LESGCTVPLFGKIYTVASRPKILQNISKPAEKRKRLAGKIGGRTAAFFWQKRQKTGQKIFY
jgi:hypothetical protein